jgi:hypothetical protein
VLGAFDKLLADFLDGFDIARCQGNADFVDLGAIAQVLAVFVFGLLATFAVLSHYGGFECTVRHISKTRWLIDAFGGCGHMSDKGLELRIKIA